MARAILKSIQNSKKKFLQYDGTFGSPKTAFVGATNGANAFIRACNLSPKEVTLVDPPASAMKAYNELKKGKSPASTASTSSD